MALHEQHNTQANGTTYHYHLDHLGRPRELTDTNGGIVWSARYRAYGNLALADVEAIDNPLRFQGQYYDQETGLHYNLNRYYDPNAGRFIHQDPIGLEGGSNVYRYAPNPVNWVDPLGLTGKDCSGGRLPQDVNVNPTPPAALPTNRPIGRSPTQNAAAQAEVQRMQQAGYRDIRVNQQQVNAEGVRVGTNRPDVQETSPAGQREYIEFDTSSSTRGPAHEVRIRANDPSGSVELRTQN